MNTKRRKSKDEVKHEAILVAATHLFLKQGFSDTSMEAIAIEARVTKQTVYSHYQSKDSLFTHMVAELSKKHAPSAALLESSDRPIEVLLNEIGQGFLNMLTSKEGLAATRLVIAELHNHPELAKRYYEDGTQRMITMFSQFLSRQKKLKILSIADPDDAAACFFSMLKGRYYVRMLLDIKPIPVAREKEKHVRETVHNFLKLYA
jgi:TetR/AcrR family transcriptional repressor of mexJK operon